MYFSGAFRDNLRSIKFNNVQQFLTINENLLCKAKFVEFNEKTMHKTETSLREFYKFSFHLIIKGYVKNMLVIKDQAFLDNHRFVKNNANKIFK